MSDTGFTIKLTDTLCIDCEAYTINADIDNHPGPMFFCGVSGRQVVHDDPPCGDFKQLSAAMAVEGE